MKARDSDLSFYKLKIDLETRVVFLKRVNSYRGIHLLSYYLFWRSTGPPIIVHMSWNLISDALRLMNIVQHFFESIFKRINSTMARIVLVYLLRTLFLLKSSYFMKAIIGWRCWRVLFQSHVVIL